MIFYPGYIDVMQKDYARFQKYELCLRRYAAARKFELLRTDFDKLKQEDHNKFISKINGLYQSLVFYPDSEIIGVFKDLGMTAKHLKWFTEIELITKEFSKINFESPLFILPFCSTNLIDYFFAAKIKNEIFEWANLFELFEKGKYRSILYTAYLKKSKKRKRYFSREAPNQDILDLEYNALIELLNAYTENEENSRKFLLNYMEGNVEKYFIKEIVADVLTFKENAAIEITERATFGYLYDLLRIILKDDNFLSEDEFINSKKSRYDDDFNRYQVSKIKKSLPLDKPAIFNV